MMTFKAHAPVKRAAAGLAALAVALGATACGSSQDDGGASASTAPATTASGLPGLDGTTVSYLGFGGSGDEGMERYWFGPFAAATGAEIALDSPTDYKKLQTQIETGNVEYNLVDGDPHVIDGQCGRLWEPLDVDLSSVQPQYRPASRCSVPDYVYGYNIVSDAERFPDGGPQTCRDFFDTERYPGKRAIWSYYVSGVYECAAIAAGADPRDPFPLDVDAAQAQLEQLGDDLVIYDTSAQAVDGMQNQDVAMGIYSTRMTVDAVESDAPVEVAAGWAARGYGAFGVPKGARDKEAVEALLEYVLRPEVNRKMKLGVPGFASPTGGGVAASVRGKGIVPTEAPLDDVAVDIDWEWWAENDGAVNQRFAEIAGGG